jgi:endonuclease YncB( thermonuclease family)
MVVPPNDRFIELFRAAETAAHQAHLGLWSECPRSHGGINPLKPANRALRSQWVRRGVQGRPASNHSKCCAGQH